MFTFTTVIPNIYNKQGINIIKANKIGNNTVQQNDINWSNLILGKEALTQININIIIELFIPKVILCKKPSTEELVKISLNLKYSRDVTQFISKIYAYT
jgi:hypothetical protein